MSPMALTTGGSGMSLIVMLLVYGAFFLVLYLVFFRPQNKKKKKEAEMRKNAQVGDEITTIGGIAGRIVDRKRPRLCLGGGIAGRIVAVKEETESVIIETGSDKSKLRIKRWAIGSVDTVHEDDGN